MKGGMNKILKQVQKAQAEMARMQERLGEITVQSSSGGGAVKAEMNGHRSCCRWRLTRRCSAKRTARCLKTSSWPRSTRLPKGG